jgi:cobalt/nickel transport system permease protein
MVVGQARETAVSDILARLDPRTRVLAAALFAAATVTAPTGTGQGLAAATAALVAALALCALARLPARAVIRRLLALEAFLLFAVATLPFTVDGTALFTLWGLPASAEGCRRAGATMLRGAAVVLAVQALLATLDTVALGHALGRLGLPERLVALLLFTVRYLDVLHQEYGRLRLAMRARAFRPRTGWHTWRTMGWLVGMLVVMSVERAQRIHAAMRLRGFAGRFHLLDERRPGALDWGFGAAQLGLAATIFLLGA